MIVSDAKRDANRRNALKSTGPKTPEGKERSRGNALKHGLTALTVAPEDAAALQEVADECFWSLRPKNAYQAEIVEQIAFITFKTRRAQRIERKLREQLALRAVTSWDEDRRIDAERVGRDLMDRPSEVVVLLRQTPQGCDWLIERWAGLARLADLGDAWPEDRGRLAFDLLGTPAELRVGDPCDRIDLDGRPIHPGLDRAELARAQIAALREYREIAAEHDAIARELTEADLTDEATPEIRKIRRYEATLHKRHRWCMAALKEPIPENRPPGHLAPKYHEPRTPAEIEAEIQAELDAKAEAEARLQAEYDAKELARETALAKARAMSEARALARARKKAEANAKAVEAAQAPTEAKPGAENEATTAEITARTPTEARPEVGNGATIEPGTPISPEITLSEAGPRSQTRSRELEGQLA